ncbi:hypothetical protein HPP92_006255 [Vanilla planifolia]|uniref:Uncharacterized protein n=1 Tax=Vanilla planifolia TaxID=51239 RepID=A0A835RW48_VANPL|nr:hypothetical protein HPP92_006255 [Vanilla planifolia]
MPRGKDASIRLQARSLAHNTEVFPSSTIITIDGELVNTSDIVSYFEEMTKRRLDKMNRKLMDLEMQMEVLEREMKNANEFC